MEDAAGGSGFGADASALPEPAPEDAQRLGSPGDLQYFVTRLRDVCTGVDEVVTRVAAVLSGAEGAHGAEGEEVDMDGGTAERWAGGGGPGVAAGGLVLSGELSTEALSLLNRQLKAYCAGF
jgi:hypothetical protein